LVKVENEMLNESGALEKIRFFETRIAKNESSKPIFPNNFTANFHALKSQVKRMSVNKRFSLKSNNRASMRISMGRR
jgi:hypothetical protein